MMENTKEIMTFRSGQSLFGVPIQNVLSIIGESDKLYCKAFRSKDALGIIEYRGTPVAVMDLAIAGNIISDSEAKQSLAKQLEKFQQDHINWLDSLEKSIVNDESFSIPDDSHSCDFGLWYDSFNSNDEELKEIINEFGKPHNELHTIAKEVLKLNSDKNENLALIKNARVTSLAKLHNIFTRSISQLNSSIKSVFIYLTLDGITPCAALKIDEIEDVQQIEEDSFVAMTEMALPQVNDMKYIEGFLKLGEKGDCLLINVEILTNHRDMDIDNLKSA